MKRKVWMALIVLALGFLLAACGNDDNEADELDALDVDFDPPEEADVDETIEFKADVTFGGEKVTDAQDMQFEYWKAGDRENNTFEDGENNDDGSYSIDVSFDEDGVYEVFAHTTAEGMHDMPKKYIAVGDATEEDVEEAKESEEDDEKGGMDDLEVGDDDNSDEDKDEDNANNDDSANDDNGDSGNEEDNTTNDD